LALLKPSLDGSCPAPSRQEWHFVRVDQQHVIVPQLGFSHRPMCGCPSLGRVVDPNNDHPAARSAAALMNVDLLSLHGPMVAIAVSADHDHWSSIIGTFVPGMSGFGLSSAGLGPTPLPFGDLAAYGDSESGEVRTWILPNA
jgi:hypothetical protein